MKLNNKDNDKEHNQDNKNDSKKFNNLENQLSSKDAEIKALKQKLKEAQQVNKAKTGDIKAKTNLLGDVARVCVGVDEFGRRLWKKATELSESDIKKREEYIQSIKQLNAKKY